MRKPIRKAVLPVAGLGTRFLPATKADAQGNADGGRPADPAARRRRGARGGRREIHLRHRAQQGRHRGPFRHRLRARRHAAPARQAEGDRRADGRHAAGGRGDASPASRPRSGSATPCGARATSSATSRSRCCCPTWSPRRGARGDHCLAQCVEVYEQHGGNIVAVEEVSPDETQSLRHRRRSARTKDTLSRSRAWSKSRRRARRRRT